MALYALGPHYFTAAAHSAKLPWLLCQMLDWHSALQALSTLPVLSPSEDTSSMSDHSYKLTMQQASMQASRIFQTVHRRQVIRQEGSVRGLRNISNSDMPS